MCLECSPSDRWRSVLLEVCCRAEGGPPGRDELLVEEAAVRRCPFTVLSLSSHCCALSRTVLIVFHCLSLPCYCPSTALSLPFQCPFTVLSPSSHCGAVASLCG